MKSSEPQWQYLTDAFFFHHPAATIYNVNNKFYLNEKAQEITGYSTDDFESVDDWFTTVYKENASVVKKKYINAKTANFPKVDRIEFPRKDGKIRIFDFNATVKGDLEIWHLSDVTDVILTEERFSILFNHSTEPHLLFDETGMLDCNEAMVRVMNADSKGQLLSVHPAVFSPERQPCGQLSSVKRKEMDSVAKKNGSHRFDWVLRKLTGEEFQVNVTVSAISLAGKQIYLSVVQDLTEAKENQAKILTSAKMATLGEMASNIAHEINNPLAVIYAFTHKIKKQLSTGAPDKSDILTSVDKINTTVNRISKIIKGLRFFARETDNMESEPLEVKSVVTETLDICHEKMKNHGVRIDVSIEEGLVVSGQSVQLSQVFMNLISNSFDAIMGLPEKWISVTSESYANTVLLRFSDSGTGIPSHIAENMMRPFFTTKEVGKGTGLGLSVSKGIVENHGGKFVYEIYRGQTSFLIELPRYKVTSERVA